MAKEKANKKQKAKKPEKRGRKDYWEILNMDSRLETIEGWAKQGLTNQEMQKALGIGKDTFYRWQKTKPEFRDALFKGKFESNGEILAAAFRQATGYYQEVTEPFKVKTVENMSENPNKPHYEEIEIVVDHTYKKYFPPTNAMAIFMLKNRLPEQYKDKFEQNFNGGMTVNIVDDVDDIDDEKDADGE